METEKSIEKINPSLEPFLTNLTSETIVCNGIFIQDHKGSQEFVIISASKEAETSGDKVLESDKTRNEKGWRRYRGILLTIVAAMQFSLSALIIKTLGYHPFNLGVWRFSIMMLIPIPFLWHAVFWRKQKVFQIFWPINSTLFYLSLQAIVGSNSLVLLFYALGRLNVADALVISTSAPVFVTLLAFLFLGEKTGIFPIFMALLAICGVICVSRPPMFTGAANFDDNLMIGAALSFGSMMCLSTCYIIIRYLRTVHHALVNLCFSTWGFIECFVIANYLQVLQIPNSVTEVILIFTTAFLAFFAQTCITLALKYDEAGPVSLIRTSEILFAFLWQLIFLGVSPDLFSILGALLVISAVILTALRKMLSNLPDNNKYKKLFRIILI